MGAYFPEHIVQQRPYLPTAATDDLAAQMSIPNTPKRSCPSAMIKAQIPAGDHPEHPSAFPIKPYQLKEISDTIRHAADGSDWYG
jgi:hypothetical protein